MHLRHWMVKMNPRISPRYFPMFAVFYNFFKTGVNGGGKDKKNVITFQNVKSPHTSVSTFAGDGSEFPDALIDGLKMYVRTD